jgi:hypothetical protein
MYPFRVFTLSQANRAVPKVARLTDSARARLDALRATYTEDDPEAGKKLEEETKTALTEWQQAVLALGAEPKGIFTVDFRSPDPNVLWCWTVDEPEITHRHFTWESFKDREPIDIGKREWPSAN